MQNVIKEIDRLRKAALYSRDGLLAAWRDAGAFRTEAVLTPAIAAAALYFAEGGVERALLLGSWLLIIAAELLNTGIEAVTDLAADGKIHPHAKKAKDAASAAVLIACILCAVTWACILF